MKNEETIHKILESMPNYVALCYGRTDGDVEDPKRVSAVIRFSEAGFGFGEVCIIQTPEGCFIDGETMSPERIKKFLCALVDSAILDSDRDPEKHALYNKVTNRYCGGGCKICYPVQDSA